MHRRIRGVLQRERHRHALVVADLPQRRLRCGRELRAQAQHLRRRHRQNHQVGLGGCGVGLDFTQKFMEAAGKNGLIELGFYPKLWLHLEKN